MLCTNVYTNGKTSESGKEKLENMMGSMTLSTPIEYVYPVPLSLLPRDLTYTLNICSHELTIRLLAEYLSDLLAVNDTSSVMCMQNLSRFHSETTPNIDVLSYLLRFSKYAPAGNECFLGMFAYVDALCHLTPLHQWHTQQRARSLNMLGKGLAPFSTSYKRRKTATGTTVLKPATLPGLPIYLTSYTVNRLLISAMVVSMKFFSDIFYTNLHMSKVGGLSMNELNQLEMEFLLLTDFTLDTPVEVLGSYGQFLIDYVARKRLPQVAPSAEIRRSIPAASGVPSVFASPGYSAPLTQRIDLSMVEPSALPKTAPTPSLMSIPSPSSISMSISLHNPPVQVPADAMPPSTPLQIGSPTLSSTPSTINSFTADGSINCYNGTLTDSGYGSFERRDSSPLESNDPDTPSLAIKRRSSTVNVFHHHPYDLSLSSPQRTSKHVNLGAPCVGSRSDLLHRRHSSPNHHRATGSSGKCNVDREYLTMMNAFSGPRNTSKRVACNSLGRNSHSLAKGYSLYYTGSQHHGGRIGDIPYSSVHPEIEKHPYLSQANTMDSVANVYPHSNVQGASLYRSDSIHGGRAVTARKSKIPLNEKDFNLVNKSTPGTSLHTTKSNFVLNNVAEPELGSIAEEIQPNDESKSPRSNDLIWNKLFFFL